MSTENAKKGAAAAATPKVGFGIKKETRGASQLKFKPDPAIYDGLCLGYLKDVVLGTATYKEDQKGEFAEFAGKTVPTLQFILEGFPSEVGAGVPVHIHSYKPTVIIPGDNKYGWFYDGMFQTIKHFIDVLSEDKFLEEYEELLALEIDIENGMEFDAMIAAYTKFFNGVITVFKGDGKLPSLIADEKGVAKILWIKLLLYNKDREVNNGNFGFGNYPGDGLIELYRKDVKPALNINIAKGESIIPREKATNTPAAPAATTTGIPNTAGGAVTGTPSASKLPSFMTGGGDKA